MEEYFLESGSRFSLVVEAYPRPGAKGRSPAQALHEDFGRRLVSATEERSVLLSVRPRFNFGEIKGQVETLVWHVEEDSISERSFTSNDRRDRECRLRGR